MFGECSLFISSLESPQSRPHWLLLMYSFQSRSAFCAMLARSVTDTCGFNNSITILRPMSHVQLCCGTRVARQNCTCDIGVISKARQRWSAKLLSISIAWLLVYSAGLNLGYPPQFLQGVANISLSSESRVKSFFASRTHGTVFNRIRQVVQPTEERASGDHHVGTRPSSYSLEKLNCYFCVFCATSSQRSSSTAS